MPGQQGKDEGDGRRRGRRGRDSLGVSQVRLGSSLTPGILPGALITDNSRFVRETVFRKFGERTVELEPNWSVFIPALALWVAVGTVFAHLYTGVLFDVCFFAAHGKQANR